MRLDCVVQNISKATGAGEDLEHNIKSNTFGVLFFSPFSLVNILNLMEILFFSSSLLL